ALRLALSRDRTPDQAHIAQLAARNSRRVRSQREDPLKLLARLDTRRNQRARQPRRLVQAERRALHRAESVSHNRLDRLRRMAQARQLRLSLLNRRQTLETLSHRASEHATDSNTRTDSSLLQPAPQLAAQARTRLRANTAQFLLTVLSEPLGRWHDLDLGAATIVRHTAPYSLARGPAPPTSSRRPAIPPSQ